MQANTCFLAHTTELNEWSAATQRRVEIIRLYPICNLMTAGKLDGAKAMFNEIKVENILIE